MRSPSTAQALVRTPAAISRAPARSRRPARRLRLRKPGKCMCMPAASSAVGRHLIHDALARRDRGLRRRRPAPCRPRDGASGCPGCGRMSPQISKLLALRGDQIAGVAGRVPVERHRGDAGKHLALRLAALVLVRRDLLARPAEEAHLLALGRARHRGIVEPVLHVALRDHQLDMRDRSPCRSRRSGRWNDPGACG